MNFCPVGFMKISHALGICIIAAMIDIYLDFCLKK